ncbi:hypothetical protein HUU53_02405 [Candidatus Micrarchaeota archaeon]|nr:hypothetical protein [Candidatus Micrarchaeota archaeon]
MKRGQAFDTMMLVISVIVAVAILGVLLNILGSFQAPGGNAKDTITQDMQSIVSSGYGYSQAKQLSFDRDASIDTRELTLKVAVLPEQVRFVCADGYSGCDGPITISDFGSVTDGKVVFNSAFKSWVVVCGDDVLDPVKYYIAFGGSGAGARDKCEACITGSC